MTPTISTGIAENRSMGIESTTVLEAKVSALQASVAMANRQVREAGESAKKSPTLTKQQRDEAQGIMQSVGAALAGSEGALAELSSLMSQAPEIRSTYDVLLAQMEMLRQRSELQPGETIYSGLITEALVHEIRVMLKAQLERASDLKKFPRQSILDRGQGEVIRAPRRYFDYSSEKTTRPFRSLS